LRIALVDGSNSKTGIGSVANTLEATANVMIVISFFMVVVGWLIVEKVAVCQQLGPLRERFQLPRSQSEQGEFR
jgi:hypothetical protein